MLSITMLAIYGTLFNLISTQLACWRHASIVLTPAVSATGRSSPARRTATAIWCRYQYLGGCWPAADMTNFMQSHENRQSCFLSVRATASGCSLGRVNACMHAARSIPSASLSVRPFPLSFAFGVQAVRTCLVRRERERSSVQRAKCQVQTSIILLQSPR